MQYWILVLFSIVILSGIAGAHPHELGEMGHGSSLENYQIKLDFTAENVTKDWHNPDITLAKKNSTANSNGNDKSNKSQKFDTRKRVKEDKDRKQKEH